ncbi:RNA-binding (RRM/RBD/RNP motifs) family protein [Striga asiatica]|uniref:RNA-binding (RRM/RBD/RNP motifs) family protein n=1 Tax=Striga asiatica TaxID=4170 RepID=A0A5A7QPL9_STRAF|nr:RNA-binding (RRM/RBD/RNP motifs) family protein [Striga asiatica]
MAQHHHRHGPQQVLRHRHHHHRHGYVAHRVQFPHKRLPFSYRLCISAFVWCEEGLFGVHGFGVSWRPKPKGIDGVNLTLELDDTRQWTSEDSSINPSTNATRGRHPNLLRRGSSSLSITKAVESRDAR